MDENSFEGIHRETVRKIAPECTVLLRSDGSFPLGTAGPLALYGNGARHTVMGGTGSGAVNTRGSVTAERGLEAAGFTLTTKAWLDAYDRVRISAQKAFCHDVRLRAKKNRSSAMLEGMGLVMPEPDYPPRDDTGGEAAVYVLSRICGEGNDRRAIPGDVLLTETEQRDILLLNRRYERFLLVLNVGAPVDLSPLGEVKNILLLSQLGMDTGNVLADLLIGTAYPSGKLAATWSAWGSYCEEGDFAARDETRYREGIYVGYRFFDTVGRTPLFPFGHGLGYTDFSVAFREASADGETVTVRAQVTNTGTGNGKETAQLYVSVPGKKLHTPYQGLVAFVKTAELAPGCSEEVSLTFRLSDTASYDTVRKQWFLDGGDYILRLGTSSAKTTACALVRLNGDVVTRKTRNCCGVPGFADWKPENPRRAEPPVGVPVVTIDANEIPISAVDYSMNHAVAPEVHGMTDRELAYLSVGRFSGSGNVIGDTSQSVAGAAGETTSRLSKRGIKPLVMADGPAGIRLSSRYVRDKNGERTVGPSIPADMLELLPPWQAALLQLRNRSKRIGFTKTLERYATAIPIATAVAQSWNLSLAEDCGKLVGEEAQHFGVGLWLAPALNIQRDIRCGRNFEYYSEDPMLSGCFAAAMTRGAQKSRCGVTIMHFAANSQETNRYNNNSQVSERAMREIYLRGFERCIREAGPLALMTSYNLLNGVHTSEHRGLIEDILRCEFGFNGVVMTDWIAGRKLFARGSRYPVPAAGRIAAAGGDLVMPGEKTDVEDILQALKKGTLRREQLEINASRVLKLLRALTDDSTE